MPTEDPAAGEPVEAGDGVGPMLVGRSMFGGVLMGLANLVPGISGGTMLLAAGVYPRFISAIAEVTRLTFRWASMVVLAGVMASALTAIVLLAGTVKTLVVEHRWIMYSLFIGLTLGGVPVVWGMIRRPGRSVYLGAAVGLAGMAVLAWFQVRGETGTGHHAGFGFMLLAGMVAASAMILPGVSGGYLFLVLGVYVPVLSGIDALKEAVAARDLSAAWEPVRSVVLPVGIGVVLGVVVVSNGLRWLLDRYEKPTLGCLLGLLLGAVVGLWPFQQGVAPQPGDVIKGQAMTAETIAQLSPDDDPTQFFRPTPGQIAGSLGLIALGFAATALVSRLGGNGEDGEEP